MDMEGHRFLLSATAFVVAVVEYRRQLRVLECGGIITGQGLRYQDLFLETRMVRIEENADSGIVLFFCRSERCCHNDEAGIDARL
jgi:hypothetical protein